MRDLFYYLVSNATTLVNYASLAKKLGLDAKTVKEYIGFFEENFLITLVTRHHNKLAETIKSAKKVYLNDNGFLNLGVNSERNYGNALKNLVFTALNAYGKNVTCLKENGEVDFLVKDILIQVAYAIEDEKTRNRELRALAEFRKPEQKALLITFDTDETTDEVEIMRFDRFILTNVF